MDVWFVVVNPVSGGGRGERDWPRIASLLDEAGVAYTHKFAVLKNDVVSIVEKAVREGFRKIMVVGGDGSMHEVLNALYGQREVPMNQIVMGIIPVGTGNDWVRHCGIPHDYRSAVEVIRSGRVYGQDLIVARYQTAKGVGERVVANIAGIGLDASVIEAVDRAGERGHKGRLTYLGCLIKTVLTHKARPYRIVIDGREQMCDDLFSAAVGNNRFNGGGLEQLPCAVANDGLSEVMILRRLRLSSVPRALWRLLRGRINDIPEVLNCRCRTISFTSDVPRPVELDGELVGYTAVDFVTLPSALQIMIPADSEVWSV